MHLFRRATRSWTEEDIETVEQRLAEEFPQLQNNLRCAIANFSAQELDPRQGRERLIRLATRYARECPRTIGMEAALSS